MIFKTHFEELDSTSTHLKKNYLNYDNMTFVSASYQTNGHGRNNRKWYSNSHENLLFSILIKEQKLIEKYRDISLSSAVCVYQMLKELKIKDISIKWPNDVYVKDKKISGILLESISEGENINALVIGVGINVNSTKFSKDISQHTTSIKNELNRDFALDKIANIVYSNFIKMFNKLKKDDRSYLEIVKNNNYLKGKEVYAIVENKKILVTVLDVNNDNTLKIKKGNESANIESGEVTFNM